METLVLTGRTLGLLRLPDFCPRCFWLIMRCDNKFPFQVPMPGIFNSIDAYGKKIVHTLFDLEGTLPPWFPGLRDVVGYVPGRELHWSRFKAEDPKARVVLRGTPDDIFRLSDKSFHIVDYKTAKATEKQDDLFPMYEVQLNAYAYISNRVGLSPLSGLSLIYTEPQTELVAGEIRGLSSEEAFSLRFKATLRSVELRADTMIPELVRRAREIYESAAPPEGRDQCRDCGLLRRLLAASGPPEAGPA